MILFRKALYFSLLSLSSGVFQSNFSTQMEDNENDLLDRLRNIYGDIPINAILDLESSEASAKVSLLSMDPPIFIIDGSNVGNELLEAERSATKELNGTLPLQVRVLDYFQFGIYDLNTKDKEQEHTEEFLKLLSGKDKLPVNADGKLSLKVRMYNEEDMEKEHRSLLNGEAKHTTHDLKSIMEGDDYLKYPPISRMHIDEFFGEEEEGEAEGHGQGWEQAQAMKFTFIVDLDDVGGTYFPFAKPRSSAASADGVSVAKDLDSTGIFVHSLPGRLLIFSCNDDISHHLESCNHAPFGQVGKQQDRKVIVSGMTWPLQKSTGLRGSLDEGAETILQLNGVHHDIDIPDSVDDTSMSGTSTTNETEPTPAGPWCFKGPNYELCGTYDTCPEIDGKKCDCNVDEKLSCSDQSVNCTSAGHPEITGDRCIYTSLYDFDLNTCKFDAAIENFECPTSAASSVFTSKFLSLGCIFIGIGVGIIAASV